MLAVWSWASFLVKWEGRWRGAGGETGFFAWLLRREFLAEGDDGGRCAPLGGPGPARTAG